MGKSISAASGLAMKSFALQQCLGSY